MRRAFRAIWITPLVVVVNNCFFTTDTCACSDPVAETVVFGTVTSGGGPVPGAAVWIEPFGYTDTVRVFETDTTGIDGWYAIRVADIVGINPRMVANVEPDSSSLLAGASVPFTPNWLRDSVRVDVLLNPR